MEMGQNFSEVTWQAFPCSSCLTWLGIGQEQGLTTAALAVVIAVRDAVLLEVDVLAVRAAEVRVSFFFVHLDRLLQLDLRLLQLALRRLQLGQKFLQRNG